MILINLGRRVNTPCVEASEQNTHSNNNNNNTIRGFFLGYLIFLHIQLCNWGVVSITDSGLINYASMARSTAFNHSLKATLRYVPVIHMA